MIDLIVNNAQKNIDCVDFSKLKNKRVLLTGCTGLIGIHLLSALKLLKDEYNIEIYCLINSDFEAPFDAFFKDCFVVKGDLVKSDSIDYLLNIFSENQVGVDYIIHSAGYAQPKKFTEDKLNTILLNTKTTSELFKLLNPGGSFLFLSTSELYSGLDSENITEDEIGTTTPDHPRSCYIDAKRCGESIVHSFKERGFNAKIARVSLSYGPGTKKNDSRVMSDFVTKALANNQINLMDDGQSIRTYCYVSDTTEMLWNILLHGKDTVYNVAGTSKISILGMANKIAEILNCEVSCPKDNANTLQGNPKIVNLSLHKYISEFDKKEFVPIDYGIETSVEWIKTFYKEEF
jgi:nucleoside-diphosphate-sugar epimerase